VIELPEIAMPKPVEKAAAVVRDREADVAAAKAQIEAANIAIQHAVVEDRALFADALDAGGDDPGTPRADEASARLADAERRLAGEELRMMRAREALNAALSESITAWEAAVTKATEQAERDSLKLVDQLAAAERERARRRHAVTWARRYRQGEKLPNLGNVPRTPSALVKNPIASPFDTYGIVDLLDVVRDVTQAMLAAEHERQAEQELQRLRVA
jgi:hypothetical protein